MNKQTSQYYGLIVGSPQGSILGQLLYIIGSDDVAEEVPEYDKYKFISDLTTLEAVYTKDKLFDYDYWE